MSAIDVFKDVAKEFSIDVPTIVTASTEREHVELVDMSQKACEEIARRVNWPRLRKSTTVTGTGAPVVHDLPSDFSRLIKGASVSVGGVPLRGGLSDDEWAALPATAGTPRYFRVSTNTIEFWPYLANGVSATIYYQSKNWNGATAKWVADTDVALIDETLITKGTIIRLRRLKGLDFADHLAEFEQALTDFATFEPGQRSP